MKTFWGDNENDLTVDNATPLLIRMLALCQDILDTCGGTTDAALSDALNVIDVEERLTDALCATRAYQIRRETEMKKGGSTDGR